MYALYSQTGAAVSVNYLTTEYVARVYLILGEREKSVGYRYNLISRGRPDRMSSGRTPLPLTRFPARTYGRSECCYPKTDRSRGTRGSSPPRWSASRRKGNIQDTSPLTWILPEIDFVSRLCSLSLRLIPSAALSASFAPQESIPRSWETFALLFVSRECCRALTGDIISLFRF